MTFWSWLRGRCECCNAPLPERKGWVSMGTFFSVICDPCFAVCFAENGRWIHRVRRG